MKISQLAQATTVNDEDVFPVVQDGETKKVTAKTLLKNQPTDIVIDEENNMQLMADDKPVGNGVPIPLIDAIYKPKSTNAQSGVAVAEALGDVANAIKNTVSGNPIIIDDASPLLHTLDIVADADETVYVRGKNIIPFDNKAYNNGKYAAGQTYEINGVSLTVNDDGSVYATGTSTGAVVFPLFTCSAFATGIHTVTLSGSPDGASATTYCLRLKNASEATANYEDYGQGKTINNVDLSGSTIYIIVISGQTIDATFYPMLCFGDTVSDFVSPCESASATADENGAVSITSVSDEMSIFTESGATIDCTYNKDTEKAIDEQINCVKEDIQKLNYRLINSVTLDEDVQLITFSNDAEGNALNKLNLSKAFILFTGSFVNTTASQPLCVLFNGGGVYQMYCAFNITADKSYGFWLESEKIISLSDRTVYKSTYPSALLGNFNADTGIAQGLSANNVALNSDLSVSAYDYINNIKFGCFNSNNLLKAGSTVYLFGV